MPSLIDLTLTFRWNLNAELFENLVAILKGRPYRKLKLLFERQEFDEAISKKFAASLKKENLPYLEDLHLSMRSLFVQNFGIEALIPVLPELKQLQALTLMLDENKLTAKHLEGLGGSIETLTSLQKIHLSMQKNNQLKEGVVPLSKSISKCPNLNSITLDFQTCSVTFDDYCNLYDEIIKMADNLRLLSISI